MDDVKRRIVFDTGNWAALGGKRRCRYALDGLPFADHQQVDNAGGESTVSQGFWYYNSDSGEPVLKNQRVWPRN